MSLDHINQTTPMAVLSVDPGRRKWCLSSILVAAIFHVVILATLSGEKTRPPDQADATTIEMIQAPPTPSPEAETEPPAAHTPVAAAAAEDAMPYTPRENPVPANASPEPALLPPTPAPEAAPITPQQAPVAGPPTQQTVMPENATSVTVNELPLLPAVTVASKAIHSAQVIAVQRHPGLPAATIRPATNNLGDVAARAVMSPAANSSDGAVNRPTNTSLTGQIRNAVQAAVQCPAAARMMGQSGKAAVTFDYRNGGLVGGLQISQSSGLPILDAAALTAVRSAHYPKPPPADFDQVLHLLVWVDEACSD